MESNQQEKRTKQGRRERTSGRRGERQAGEEERARGRRGERQAGEEERARGRRGERKSENRKWTEVGKDCKSSRSTNDGRSRAERARSSGRRLIPCFTWSTRRRTERASQGGELRLGTRRGSNPQIAGARHGREKSIHRQNHANIMQEVTIRSLEEAAKISRHAKTQRTGIREMRAHQQKAKTHKQRGRGLLFERDRERRKTGQQSRSEGVDFYAQEKRAKVQQCQCVLF
ncbi:hypothetical protein TGFOU_406160 [Toxoplasma gondii FOU]|uniref:Uncharacterized protein n=1 Tax=Toxoplasma gondii FOU TaxID=943167 RepID=A0A086JRS8_TOXGO|nr:hypothetical protein TGFOU_406160 [Toxoplasma gondii FOU]